MQQSPNDNKHWANAAASGGSNRDCYSWVKKGSCPRQGCPYDHHDHMKGSGKGRPRSSSAGKKGKDKGSKGKGKGNAQNRSQSAQTKSPRGGKGKDKGNKGKKGQGKGKSKSPRAYTPPRTRAESRGTSPSGEKMRPPCNGYLKGTCSKGDGCNYWHVPMCRFMQRGACRAGEGKCIFLHELPPPYRGNANAAQRSPRKRSKKGNKQSTSPHPKAKAKAKAKANGASPLNA